MRHEWTMTRDLPVLGKEYQWTCFRCGTTIASDDFRDWADRVAWEAGVDPGCEELVLNMMES